MEAGSFFLDQDEGNTLRIQEIDLDTLIFRGSLISSWLTPEQFKWEYRLPHETEPHKYHLAQYNAKPLYVRAGTQVVPGPKLSVFLGAVPADNIAAMQGSTLGQYPLIFVEKFSVPFLPFEPAGMNLGVGPYPLPLGWQRRPRFL